ncbi:MAG: hypothetical protein L0177_02530 [Chloroflexi bacterium]|nr:hypothetical protein [Chloroflexota bacterium]
MATSEQIQKLLNGLSECPGCNRCGVRIRFGDLECPRCGADLEDDLWEWAERLIDEIEE